MPTRRKLSLFSWEPFLLGTVLLSGLVASLTVRIGAFGLVVGAVAALVAVPAIYQLVRLGFRESQNGNSARRLAALHDFKLHPAETRGVLVLDESRARQDSIDLALGWSTTEQTRVVLWPDATRWLGRELRTEAYILGGARPARAGFLPRAADGILASRLGALRAEGMLVTVPATILGDGKRVDPTRTFTRLSRPFTVEVGRPDDDLLLSIQP